MLVAWTGFQGLTAKNALESAAADLAKVAADLGAGDVEAARGRLEDVQDSAATARSNTRGPGWWLGSKLPGIGDDVSAVRTVADVTDVIASDVMPDVVSVAQVLHPDRLAPRNGRFRLAPIRAATDDVLTVDEQLRRQSGRVQAIDRGALVPQLAGPVGDLADQLGQASAMTERASYAVRLLPPMLGADGPRTHLLLFQNNAEIRATGGIPGSVAVLSARKGKLEIVDQGTARDFGRYDAPPLRLTAEERTLYGDKLGIFGADINFTPDFPRTGQLARTMWRTENGVAVDGVMSIDPVALSYLLEGTGPVEVPGGPALRAKTAVEVLLQDVYLQVPDTDAQDAYFAAAAEAVFDAVASGQGDSARMLRGLTRAVSEGRINLWSARKAEQSLIAETALSGRVPREEGDRPFVGVFMNDGTASKLQYYFRHRVDVEPVSCNPEGRQTLEVTVTVRSTAPKNAAELPPSVIGPRTEGAYFGVEPGDQRVNVHLYAPIGGWIESSAVDGEETPLSEAEHLGHPVGSRSVTLTPGQERTLTYRIRGALDQTGDPRLRVTPGVHGDGVGRVSISACTLASDPSA